MLKLFKSLKEFFITLELEENVFDFSILEVKDFIDIVGYALKRFVLLLSCIIWFRIIFGFLLVIFLLIMFCEIDFYFFMGFFHHYLIFVLEFSFEAYHLVEKFH